jgi:hypothetical protein
VGKIEKRTRGGVVEREWRRWLLEERGAEIWEQSKWRGVYFLDYY